MNDPKKITHSKKRKQKEKEESLKKLIQDYGDGGRRLYYVVKKWEEEGPARAKKLRWRE